jgi:hypothetical protein
VLERLANLIPDPEARARALAQAQNELMQTISNSDASQANINAAEAQHRSVFVAGWRPFIGWVCGAALGIEFLVRPLLSWGFPDMPPMPSAGDGLWVVVTGILGLGAYRTLEKTRNVTR